jgi:hypothetical protein
MTQQESNEVYFTRSVMCKVIEQSWEDALNFKKYKSDYVQQEIDKSREEAIEWFAGEEFETWCGALGLDYESIRELLSRKIELTNQAE